MKRLVVILGLALLLGSCQFLKKKSDDNEPEFRKTEIGHPIVYKISDPSCDEKHALADLGKVRIWFYNKPDRKVGLVDIDLSGVSGKGLKHHVITEALYGVEVHSNERSNELRNHGKPVYICKKEYPRDSIENVALASVSGILESYRFHQTTQGSKRNSSLESVTLLIHPKLSEENYQYQTSMTDNAFYLSKRAMSNIAGAPHFLKNNVIAVLPHSTEYFQPIFGGIALWELRSVLSHEFGHHIFEKYLGSSTQFFGEKRSFHSLAFQDNSAAAKNGLVIASLNEGFADLTAYYAHDSGLDPLSGLFFGGDLKNRDVASCGCDDDSPKRITQYVLETLFRTVDKSKTNAAASPNYKDIHIVGAFFATGANRIWADRFGSTATVPRTAEKAPFLFEWLQKMGPYIKNNKDTEDSYKFMEKLVFDAVSLGSKDGEFFDKQQCEHLENSFPVFVDGWKKEKPSCSKRLADR